MIATNDQVARAYDAIASEYDAQLGWIRLRRTCALNCTRIFSRVFHPADRVLDFTAGTGLDALFLAARGSV